MTMVTHGRVLAVWSSISIVGGLAHGWIEASNTKEDCAKSESWCFVTPGWVFVFALILAALVWRARFLGIEVVTAASHWAKRRR
jgi:hypothetical protein